MKTSPAPIKDCADEPITIPGSIQSHGLLFAINSETRIIEQVSANTLDHLGFPPEELLGTAIAGMVVAEHREVFLNLVNEASESYVNPFVLDVVRKNDAPLRCDGIAHPVSQSITILELEPIHLNSRKAESLENYFQLVQSSLSNSESLSEVADIADLMATKVRQFTGYDRVMVYRFAEDFSGEVIAEARQDDMEPYLHLRYPASDIPAQARALYLKNWVRLLHNVDGEISPLVPVNHPRLDAPTPLGKSVLRSVSPIHLQYLRHMGVGSTLTISLVVDDRLWGLVACHHRTPRFVSWGTRATSSLFGMVMSAHLARAEKNALSLEKSVGKKQIASLLNQLNPVDDFESTLAKILPSLLEVMNADGASFHNPETTLSHGQTPPSGDVAQLGNILTDKHAQEPYFTEILVQDYPELAHLLPTVAGLISIPLGTNSWLMIFRKEHATTIRWGGNPYQKNEPNQQGYLTPRKSFSEWIEQVKSRSKSWAPFIPELIDDLRAGLSGFLMSRNKILESSNEELRHFASVIAHEVKSQLQAPLMALSIIEERNDGDEKISALTEVGISALTTLTGLTSEMLSFAQHDINLTDFTEVNFDDLVRTALDQSLGTEKKEKIQTIVHQLPTFSASPHQSHHVFLNLIRNALIHGPGEKQSNFQLEIGAKQENNEHVFFVRDNGQGIHPDDQEKIFEYFQRGSHSTNRKGSGIGLAFIRRLLERNGGNIRVESQPGQGSTFYFTIGNKTENS